MSYVSCVELRFDSEDILESITDDDIAKYCYKQNIISKEQALEHIDNKDETKLTKFGDCYISVPADEVLDKMWEDDIYDYLEDANYIFPEPPEPDPVVIDTDNRKYWVKIMREQFGRLFCGVYDKEEFKKDLCKVIDEYWY